MSSLCFILGEARNEFRSAMRGPLVPLVFLGLIGYETTVVLNAEYMREMGAAEVARNSGHVVQLMTVGQSFWLFFAWAWFFARAVTRDRDARLHELVLAAPISIRRLFVGRYLGALGVAVLLGLSSPLGFLVVHPLEALGVLPASGVAPPPWGAMLWSWLVFTVPSAVGGGAVYLAAALRTRSTAGPFTVAAVLMCVWMFSMVILRGGDIDPAAATLIDPTGFGEAERQTLDWTPAEKMTNLVALTPVLVINRVAWGVLPLLSLVWTLFRLRREDVALGRAARRTRSDGSPVAPTRIDSWSSTPAVAPSWLRATLSEAGWHLRRSLTSWGIWIAMGLLCLMCIAGSFVHVVAHAEGPFVPRPELLVPVLSDFLYITITFVIAGFVGVLMRRDDQVGFYGVVSAAWAPLGVRLGGRALAAAGLVFSLMLVPIVACFTVVGVVAPNSFSFGTPVLYFLLAYAPGLLELGAVTILCHALFRSSGLAYSVSMLAAFILVMNHEVVLVSYPLAMVGLPAEVSLSALVGWEPWLAPMVAQGTFKLGVFVILVSLASLAWSRGYPGRELDRILVAGRRLRGGAALGLTAGLLLTLGVGGLVYDRLVVRGDYESAWRAAETQAEWERRWLSDPPTFRVDGGEVDASFDAEARRASARWVLHGVRSPEGRLQGEIPSGVKIIQASVQGRPVSVDVAADAFGLSLGTCSSAPDGCTVVLDLHAERRGWPVKAQTPWLRPGQVWLTASDLLPRLGVDLHRALRSPVERRLHELPRDRPPVPRAAASSATGVAPAGRWRWRVRGALDGWSLPAQGQSDGPLDFAVVWRSRTPVETTRGGGRAYHAPSQRGTARHTLEDLEAMDGCVKARLGLEPPRVEAIVQAPRRSELAVRGQVLLLPEDQGWDASGSGYGRWRRRELLGRALAAESLARRSDLRQEPGARWLLEGVPGWVGLSCVRELDGDTAWLALVERHADRVVQELGALEAPVEGLRGDGDATWISPYAALSTFTWAEVVGKDDAARVVAAVVEDVAEGASVGPALAQVAGRGVAEQLLGPPHASDAAVVDLGDAGKSAVPARRWTWSDGGWQSAGRGESLLVLSPVGTREERAEDRIRAAPMSLEAPEPVTLLDVWPSFERSIADNIWSPEP